MKMFIMVDEKEYRNKKWGKYGVDYAKDHEIKKPKDHLEFNVVLTFYKPHPGDNILEIGCNTGEFCYLLKKKYDAIPSGVDINGSAISIASKKYPDIDFQLKDLFELEGEYDVIYIQHVIEHLSNPQKALFRIKKILRVNGLLIVTCPNGWAFPSKIRCMLKGKKFCDDPTHRNEFNPKTIRDLMEKNGFQVIKQVTKPLGIPIMGAFKKLNRLRYKLPSFICGDYIFLMSKNR